MDEPDGKSGVIAQRTQVTEVIGHPLALQRHRAQRQGAGGDNGASHRFQRRAVRPGEGDGRIPGEARGESVPFPLRELLEPLGHPLVRVAQALLEPEHLFAHDGEAEVPGLDGAGVNRPHRDLVDSVPGHRDEGVGLGRSRSSQRTGVPAQRERLLRPPSVLEPPARITALGDDAQQVGGGTLQSPGHRKAVRQTGIRWRGGRHRVLDDDHLVRQPVGDVDPEAPVAVPVVRSPQSEENGPGALHLRGGAEPLLAIGDQETSGDVGQGTRGHRSADQPRREPIPLGQCRRHVEAQGEHHRQMDEHRQQRR